MRKRQVYLLKTTLNDFGGWEAMVVRIGGQPLD